MTVQNLQFPREGETEERLYIRYNDNYCILDSVDKQLVFNKTGLILQDAALHRRRPGCSGLQAKNRLEPDAGGAAVCAWAGAYGEGGNGEGTEDVWRKISMLTNRGTNRSAGIRPPQSGDTVLYRCDNCGERFFHKIPLLSLFGLGVKCPKCGSLKVRRDQTAAY